MYLVYCDGGSRGNPGKAATGVVIKNEVENLFAKGEYIGVATNNVAEYTALITALKKLSELEPQKTKIHLDSELVVKQINGIYKVKNVELQKLFIESRNLIAKLKDVEIVHVRREFNKEADALVNVALDEEEKAGSQGRNLKPLMSMGLQEKAERLKDIIKGYGSLVVGYSGGIDSSLLAYVALKILGEKAVAVTILGAQSIGSEIAYARNFAKDNGIRHVEIPISIFKNENLMKNTKERCYYCKLANFGLLKEYAKSHGYDFVADGGNVDDQSETRPGLKAIEELRIKSPFLEAEMTKADIKALSTYLGLNMEERESNTCLITRIPINSELTEEKLKRVDICEDFLKSKGFKSFRVRALEGIAVLELSGDINITRVLAKEIDFFFKEQDYKKVYIDMGGYKIGSMAEKE